MLASALMFTVIISRIFQVSRFSRMLPPTTENVVAGHA